MVNQFALQTIISLYVCSPIVAVDSFRNARASFRQSLKFGNIRDRGLRLAGYLTPPSDVTQEEEEQGHEK